MIVSLEQPLDKIGNEVVMNSIDLWNQLVLNPIDLY